MFSTIVGNTNLNPGLIDNVLAFLGIAFVCVCALMVCVRYTNTRKIIANEELKAMAKIEAKLAVISDIVDSEKFKRHEIKNRVIELESQVKEIKAEIQGNGR